MFFQHKAYSGAGIWYLGIMALTVKCLPVLLICLFAWQALAGSWTGEGQNPASQIRDWNVPGNWYGGVVPPPTDFNSFGPMGEGRIDLNGMQSAGGIAFADFTYSNIAPGMPGSVLSLVNAGTIIAGEGVRDTYGVDYFTAGPQISADVNLATSNIMLGQILPGGYNSALMISGQLQTAGVSPMINLQGQGNNASLWISSYNDWTMTGGNISINSPGPASPYHTYALHLTDSARLEGATVTLNDYFCALGLHDNATAGGANLYRNHVNTFGGNIFTDRSYQQNDLDSTINAVERISTVRAGFSPGGVGANFGSIGTFGRTNNGYSLLVDTLIMEQMEMGCVGVHNGNLTEERGGSRFVSGANRLQEAHNYVGVDNMILQPTTPFYKLGKGVLWINQLNAQLLPPLRNQWQNSPTVSEGVLRLGSIFTGGHTMAPGQQVILTRDSALGLGWNTSVNQSTALAVPFRITSGAGIIGQAGAVNIDIWGHSALNTINTNTLTMPGVNYLRIASSMGGNASFNPQPNPLIHASTAATIVPYIKPLTGDNEGIYYFGGGGGTLQVDSTLTNYLWDNQLLPVALEMGTTGTLLPGRVALNPGGSGGQGANSYTMYTNIRAGTLQFMNSGAVRGSSTLSLGTYNDEIINGLYDYQFPANSPYTWKGPGMLLIDPGTNKDWHLSFYQLQGGFGNLQTAMYLDGGVIGWTGDVDIIGVPGQYNTTLLSDLRTPGPMPVNVLGLGGEYSAGTMFMQFTFGDNVDLQSGKITPVLLYKAGKNSTLDLRPLPGLPNRYTGGTIIAGGTILFDDPMKLNAGEANEGGGPIAILNGGRLRAAMPLQGMPDLFLNVPVKINTDGTPDIVKNCGSVIEVDDGVQLILMRQLDVGWNPSAYLEKDGNGTLIYNAMPGNGPSNAWGLKLTRGIVTVNQLPVNMGGDTGPVIFNNGDLQVRQVLPGTFDTNPGYGFRNIVSMKNTSSTVTVDDNAMFRTHGIVPSEILGTIRFVGNDMDSDPSNNVVHLSRNSGPVPANLPGEFTRGDGAMIFDNIIVYMSGGGGGGVSSGLLNVLPKEAGFVLQLNDGVTFNASMQNDVWGEVNFNNTNTANPVCIDGAEASAAPISGPPYTFVTTPSTWMILGTGLTTWSGTTEKFGPGTVAVRRSKGAPVLLNANAFLKITGGTFEAGNTADPFTDSVLGMSLDIQNDSTATGLLISNGVKQVDVLTGTGNTTVSGPAGTELIVTSITQNTLTIGAGCKVTIKPLPGGPLASYSDLKNVPEPSTWIMLILAGAGMAIWRTRRR
jgi:hypothetical protein